MVKGANMSRYTLLNAIQDSWVHGSLKAIFLFFFLYAFNLMDVQYIQRSVNISNMTRLQCQLSSSKVVVCLSSVIHLKVGNVFYSSFYISSS